MQCWLLWCILHVHHAVLICCDLDYKANCTELLIKGLFDYWLNCQKRWFPTKHCAHTMSTFLQFTLACPTFLYRTIFSQASEMLSKQAHCPTWYPAVNMQARFHNSLQMEHAHLVSEMTICGSLPLYQIKVNIVGCSTRHYFIIEDQYFEELHIIVQ